jgi:transcriptional regulator with XRE-family HTH domain
MSKNYHSAIKQLRGQKGFSQSEIAQKMGMPRTSYVSFEQGKRDISLAEAAQLADIFGISLEDIERGVMPNYEKYKEMILAFVRCVAPADGKIPKTKLAKLVYLADFSWFYKNLESMSGMQYRKIQYGPVPDTYFRAIDELEEAGKIVIDRKTSEGKEMLLIAESQSNVKEKMSMLSEDEVLLIKSIAKKWKDKKTNEIVNFTHNQLPYLISRDNEIIPYELITQEDPEYVY